MPPQCRPIAYYSHCVRVLSAHLVVDPCCANQQSHVWRNCTACRMCGVCEALRFIASKVCGMAYYVHRRLWLCLGVSLQHKTTICMGTMSCVMCMCFVARIPTKSCVQYDHCHFTFDSVILNKNELSIDCGACIFRLFVPVVSNRILWDHSVKIGTWTIQSPR